MLLMLFHSKFKFNDNFVCCSSVPGHQIATKFCTCHDSYAVMSCAKFCSNHFIRIWMKTNRICIKIELWLKIHMWDGSLIWMVTLTQKATCTLSGILICGWAGGATIQLLWFTNVNCVNGVADRLTLKCVKILSSRCWIYFWKPVKIMFALPTICVDFSWHS